MIYLCIGAGIGVAHLYLRTRTIRKIISWRRVDMVAINGRARTAAVRTLVALMLIFMTDCGGGGGSSPSPVQPTTPASLGVSSSASLAVGPSAASTTVGVGGMTATLAFPGGTAGGTLQIVASTTLPSGLPTVQSTDRRRPQSATVALYVQVTANQNIALDGSPTFASNQSITGVSVLPPGASSWNDTQYSVATNKVFVASGPFFSLSAGESYYYALYTGTPAAPNPTTTPVPTATPTVAPAVYQVAVSDYFAGMSVTNASMTVDGSPVTGSGGTFAPALPAGTHYIQISAPNYATFNGAIQVPGGAALRSIKLIPVSSLVAAWLAQINADRAANGAGSVQLDDMLSIAAYDHAADMASQGYYAHFDPIGFAPTTRSLLLKSMMMGSENIAAGFATWTQAEQAFMAEKSSLPDQAASDCEIPQNDELAGHYCNIVWPTHNWVGLAIVQLGSSPYGLYYDEEFGDLYGAYDRSTYALNPSLGTSATLGLVPESGAQLTFYDVGTLPNPVPIAISTLNADPRCLSQCPSADQWYPVNGTGTYSPPFPLSLEQNQLYFTEAYTNIPQIFVGAGAWAVFWPGGTTLPTEYSNSTLVPTAETHGKEGVKGLLVPNGGEMTLRRRL
jgi:uncharacterized protein YkwD